MPLVPILPDAYFYVYVKYSNTYVRIVSFHPNSMSFVTFIVCFYVTLITQFDYCILLTYFDLLCYSSNNLLDFDRVVLYTDDRISVFSPPLLRTTRLSLLIELNVASMHEEIQLANRSYCAVVFFALQVYAQSNRSAIELQFNCCSC